MIDVTIVSQGVDITINSLGVIVGIMRHNRNRHYVNPTYASIQRATKLAQCRHDHNYPRTLLYTDGWAARWDKTIKGRI